jgi:hypothetical protein
MIPRVAQFPISLRYKNLVFFLRPPKHSSKKTGGEGVETELDMLSLK